MARERTRTKVHAAALSLAGERPVAAITMEGIAARGGVSKQTLYRSWSSTGEILFDALLARSLDENGRVTVPNSGDLALDLATLATGMIDELVDPTQERLLRAVTAELQSDDGLAAQYRDLLLVFACGTLYQAGVATVITLAAIYAQEAMGFKTQDTIMLILVVNVTAAIGAFGFGYAQDKLGKVVALRVTLVGWFVGNLVAYFSDTREMFWVAANIAGVCMGSSQSAGRALVAYLSPAGRSAEFFGLWGVATRLAAILGPLTYGAVTWITGGNHRLAILLTGGFFVAALVVLSRVDEARGRAALASGSDS
jgi:MFS-type transporter involved in bile tolerance (Atg22 family)